MGRFALFNAVAFPLKLQHGAVNVTKAGQLAKGVQVKAADLPVIGSPFAVRDGFAIGHEV